MYKENKIMKFAGKYLELENILSWVIHTQKDEHRIFSHV